MEMTKISFNDYEEPPVSADILNDIQDNIEEYVNEKSLINEYSLNETKIGTWLGKPLYRKVIPLTSSQFGTGTATQGTVINIAHGISNIETIAPDSNVMWVRNVTPLQFRLFPSVLFSNDASANVWNGQVYFSNTNIVFELGATLINQIRTTTNAIYATIEYTKTTN